MNYTPTDKQSLAGLSRSDWEEQKEHRQKWVAALRSGTYKQTKHRLSSGGAYCCLGVACEVALQSGLDLKKVTAGDGLVEYDGVDGILPYRVQKWLGLGTSTGGFDNSDLSFFNDSGYSFEQIADIIDKQSLAGLLRSNWIEEEPEGLLW